MALVSSATRDGGHFATLWPIRTKNAVKKGIRYTWSTGSKVCLGYKTIRACNKMVVARTDCSFLFIIATFSYWLVCIMNLRRLPPNSRWVIWGFPYVFDSSKCCAARQDTKSLTPRGSPSLVLITAYPIVRRESRSLLQYHLQLAN